MKIGPYEFRFARAEHKRMNIDQYISEYLLPSQFNFNGHNYPLGLSESLLGTSKTREVSPTLPAYADSLKRCPPAFAAQMVRALVLSQARFTFRNRPSSNTPRRVFGTRELEVLERPWTNATTGELLSRMEWSAGLAGNAYVTTWQPGRLRLLRADWVAIVYGSRLEPEEPGFALDGEVVAYAYQNGGFGGANRNPVHMLMPHEVAHWSPLPDPMSPGIGMSWITPALREIQGDRAATEHKLKYFENGATPNLVIKGLPAATKEQFLEMVDMMEDKHAGVANAYRTLYLTAGADATVVGSDMQQLDFKNTQGAGETRIAALSRVPAPILGIAEGLAGSSLNAGNFSQARRIFADSWVFPTLQDLAKSLAPLVNVPSDAELWFDTADMPFLREDAKDAAEIEQVKASTIVALVNGGFSAKSAISAVVGQDMNLLSHTGLVSVQLQPPNTAPPAPPALPAADGKAPANGKPAVAALVNEKKPPGGTNG